MENIKQRSAVVRVADPEEFNKTRTVTFIASDDSIDAHGTRLNQDGWNLKRFMDNPIIGYQHNVYGDGLCDKPTPDDIIGKGKNIRVEDGKLMVDIEFKPEGRSEIADKVAEDVRDGFLNTVSVGFVPVGKGKMVEEPDGREVYHFEGQELLEISVVNIPSNANAQAVRKRLRDQTAQGIVWVKRALGDDYSFTDIESMTIRQVMDLIEGKKLKAYEDNIDVTPIPTEGVADVTADVYDRRRKLELMFKINKNKLK
jgi:HK97 family phage prohead protease